MEDFMRRNTFFDYKTRLGKCYWQEFNDDGVEYLYTTNGEKIFVAWTNELAGPDGAHYHVWIDEKYSDDTDKEYEFLKKCEAAARNMGDVVRFSYDYVPSEE